LLTYNVWEQTLKKQRQAINRMKFINYLTAIKGVSIFPMISLLIFFGFFIFLGIYVFFIMDKDKIEEQKNIPIN